MTSEQYQFKAELADLLEKYGVEIYSDFYCHDMDVKFPYDEGFSVQRLTPKILREYEGGERC